MYAEVRKLHLIEELLKVNSDAILAEVEMLLAKSNNGLPRGKGFQSFSTTLSPEELSELEKNIEAGCEQINENDWK